MGVKETLSSIGIITFGIIILSGFILFHMHAATITLVHFLGEVSKDWGFFGLIIKYALIIVTSLFLIGAALSTYFYFKKTKY